jgi:ABC-type lipoprotein release transport system permease subunit
MIENTLRTQTGHIQINAVGYRQDETIDNFMSVDAAAIAELEKIPNIDNVSPRVETFAMASYGSVTKGVAVFGVSPAKEAEKSNLPSHLVRGKYLDEADEGVLIGESLSRYLGAEVGDTLAFIGQGWHGASAAGLFPVRGILKMITTEMDAGMAYISISAARSFIDMPDGCSEILISVKDNRLLDKTIDEVKRQFSIFNSQFPNFEVLSWRTTMERLLQTAESDKAFAKIIMFILYLIVGFGILGSVIMMTNERLREFAILISLGMKRARLIAVVALEMLFLSLIGVALGLAVSVPAAYWFAAHPIRITGEMAKMYSDMGMEPVMPLSTDTSIFFGQIIIVFIIACLTIIYPVLIIRKLKLNTTH